MWEILIAILGVVVAAVGVILGVWATLRARRPLPPDVNFTDIYATTRAPLEPETPARTFGVEVADLDVLDQGMATDHPVVDIKLQNSGGETVVLKRLTVDVSWARRFAVLPDLLPYVDGSGPLMMLPSATYEIDLPDPEDAADTRHTLGISHEIKGGDADRIHVRLKTTFPPNEIALYSEPGATFVYLLRFGFRYNADDRELVSRTIGVACPGNIVFVPTEDGLRRKLGRFRTAVHDIRDAVDKELADRGQPTPDWAANPPRRREDLPRLLSALNRRKVNDRFWDPDAAVARYLDEAERLCHELTTALKPDMPDGLGEIIPQARDTLTRIPALREEFSGSTQPDS